ncbi:MAG: bifunctional 3-deoxy-7-phosphoheptulonate synthase/chorismate mutase [bacterium]
MKEIREQINTLDDQLLQLLAERRKLSVEVIKYKEQNASPIRDKDREEEILSNLIVHGKKAGLDANYVTKIFYEIIDDSVRLQNNYLVKLNVTEKEGKKIIKTAIQGIEGSYSSLAAEKFFAREEAQLEFISKQTFEEVVRSVENGEADYAMLPVENTTSGGINEVYDALLHTTLYIIGEEKFHVKHCLVATEEIPINRIKKIYAHVQAAAQCSKFLATLPYTKIDYYPDTAMSVQKVKEENNPEFAAIASEEAAKIFGLPIIRTNIANQSENYTRFLIASRKPIEVDLRIPCKTSLVMATDQKPGALVDALMVFRKFNVNLTKLESRPILGNPWEEMFYLDFVGNIKDSIIQEMIDELSIHTRLFKVLGSYVSPDLERTKMDLGKLLANDVEENGENVIIEDETSEIPEIKAPKKKSTKSYKVASREYKSEDTIIKVKGLEIGGDNFVVIGGPCSVESHQQVLDCASVLKETGGHILRGGCFKPRTSPYSFQGMGFEGLSYLVDAGKIYDMPIITEVLAPEQVTEVAKYSDIIQVGARNMQNFSLLKEVGRTYRPVLLKRGMMSSIDELLNAAEYILSQGNRQVILCERGIRTFETATRNTLDLSAVPVLKELTHLPIIVDPSHALGRRNLILPLAKAAKVVGAHGIMIEFHPDPDNAKSDGEQSLTFDQFGQMMKELQKL